MKVTKDEHQGFWVGAATALVIGAIIGLAGLVDTEVSPNYPGFFLACIIPPIVWTAGFFFYLITKPTE